MGKGCLSPEQFFRPHFAMEESSQAWSASFLKDKDSTQPVPGYHLVWEYLPRL